jgi:iron uptake system component EfeO
LEGTCVSRFTRPARLATFGLGIAAFIAACGGGGASTSGPGASVPASTSGPGASVPASTSGPAGTYAVEAKEYSFTPSTISVPAGEVTFQVKNTGTEEHEFEIFQGERVVDEIEGLVPGLTLDLTVTLAAGDYQFKCLLNGHDQLGMTGTLTVTGS